ncbi:MAG: DMT family transporter [Gammaproteobacteria bacterium]|nr:DMT family transporter [Gammaproteobacteria bacterium]
MGGGQGAQPFRDFPVSTTIMTAARPVLVLLGASVLWGASWLPLKAINEAGISGVALTFGAYGLLALLLTPWLLASFGRWRHPESMRQLLLIALLGGGANLAFTTALVYGEVVRVMVLFYPLPVWGVLGGKLFLGESVDGWRWLGVVLAVGGAVLVLGAWELLDSPPSWLDLVALLSGLLFALNNLVFRAAQRVPVRTKLAAMFWGCTLLAAGILLTGLAAFPVSVVGAAWGGLILYAVFWLLLANIGSQWAVTHLEAGRASIIIIMELVTAVVTATWIGGETMDALELLGGTLILVAASIEALRAETDEPAVVQSEG